MDIPKGFHSPEEEKVKQLKIEPKEEEPEIRGSGMPARSLDQLVIKQIDKIVDTLVEESEPVRINNFEMQAGNYNLTQENIKKFISAPYKDKAKDEWLDVYLIEYKKAEQIEEDFVGLLYKQKDMAKDKKDAPSLRMLVQDKYLVLIHTYSRELDKAAQAIFDGYKREFGMNEMDVAFIRK